MPGGPRTHVRRAGRRRRGPPTATTRRAPSVASRTAGASAGASRKASAEAQGRLVERPATSARRPASNSAAGSGWRRRGSLAALLGVPEPEGHGPAWRLRPDPAGGRLVGQRRGRLGRRRAPATVEQGRRRRQRLVRVGRPDAGAGHPGEDVVDAAARRGGRPRGEPPRLARPAERRRRLGRDDQGDRVVRRRPEGRRGRLAGPGRSPVRQRTSARSTSPCVSSPPRPASVSSSTRARASAPSLRCIWARTSSIARARRAGRLGRRGQRRRASCRHPQAASSPRR